jgi:MipA family protein
MNNCIRAIAIGLGLFALPGFAEESPPAAAAVAEASVPAPASAAPLAVAPERNWRFGIALGYGSRSNPLIVSDDIPVYADIDIAWFGKRWFFDNGDLGFALIDNRLLTANLVARVNSDRVYFSKTDTPYVMISRTVAGAAPPSAGYTLTGETFTEPVALEVPDRDYAIETGVELLFGGDWGQATFSAFGDVSGTHGGYEAALEYSHRWTRGRMSLSPTLGLRYKSKRRNDYYWGIHADETSEVLPFYEAGDGINYQAGLRASVYLTAHTRLALSANYERLDQSIEDSPIVERPYVFGYFAGVAFQF